jgi:hypothetical protein
MRRSRVRSPSAPPISLYYLKVRGDLSLADPACRLTALVWPATLRRHRAFLLLGTEHMFDQRGRECIIRNPAKFGTNIAPPVVACELEVDSLVRESDLRQNSRRAIVPCAPSARRLSCVAVENYEYANNIRTSESIDASVRMSLSPVTTVRSLSFATAAIQRSFSSI